MMPSRAPGVQMPALRQLGRAAVVLAVGWTVMVAGVASLQERFLVPGAWVLPRGPEHDARLAVLAVEVHAQAMQLRAADGVSVLAWLYRRGAPRPTVLYVGGNVVVGNRPESEVEALFKGYGFDRVYHQRPDIGAAIVDLFEDLKHGATQRISAAA